MTQGRKGWSDGITPFGVQRPDRLEPPANMGEREREEWTAIVERMGADWFPRETQPVLAALCCVKVELDDINEALMSYPPGIPVEADQFKRYQALQKMRGASAAQLASLATKLRLTQQSRKDPDRAYSESKRRETQAARPWDETDA